MTVIEPDKQNYILKISANLESLVFMFTSRNEVVLVTSYFWFLDCYLNIITALPTVRLK